MQFYVKLKLLINLREKLFCFVPLIVRTDPFLLDEIYEHSPRCRLQFFTFAHPLSLSRKQNAELPRNKLI
jgi:hypothetical protein